MENFSYKGKIIYFVTICCHGKNEYFLDKDIVEKTFSLLLKTSNQFGFSLSAYCFMPDHLHLLVKGLNDKSDFKTWIKSFKQKSWYHFKRKTAKKLWQVNYFEHILKRDENIKEIAKYVLCNPVRKGIVEDPKDYKYCGSLEYELEELLSF